MAAPNFNIERAAMLLVEAMYTSDKEVARKHKVSERTLRRYRERLDSDPELAALVRLKKEQADSDWSAGLFPAIRGALEFIARATKECDPSDPDAVHAISGALKITSEVAVTKQVIDARLADQNRPADAATREVAAEGGQAPRVH